MVCGLLPRFSADTIDRSEPSSAARRRDSGKRYALAIHVTDRDGISMPFVQSIFSFASGNSARGERITFAAQDGQFRYFRAVFLVFYLFSGREGGR
jgi:hypothetical protein